MPHIDIKLYPGRSDEEKKLCAEKVAKALAEALGSKETSISVSFRDIPPEEWKEKVWDVHIADKEHLFKEPGYTME